MAILESRARHRLSALGFAILGDGTTLCTRSSDELAVFKGYSESISFAISLALSIGWHWLIPPLGSFGWCNLAPRMSADAEGGESSEILTNRFCQMDC